MYAPHLNSVSVLTATNVKIIVNCFWSCLVWHTNRDAQSYCEGTIYYTSALEPEYSTLHSIGIPQGMKDVIITAISRNGQTVSYEVK